MLPYKPPRCLFCGRGKVTRPRGLCWACYYTPGVKERFPSTHPKGRRGVGGGNGPAPMPEPTSTVPGTPERLAVLEERAKRHESLFHPNDAN